MGVALNIVQAMWESKSGDTDMEMRSRRSKTLFLGFLFMGNIIAAKIIGQIMHDLIGMRVDRSFPAEHEVESACYLILIIGRRLQESSIQGKQLTSQFLVRLGVLKGAVLDEQDAYPK